MPEYRIIDVGTTETAETGPIVEVRLTGGNDGPRLQARNPGGDWSIIAWLNPCGKLGLGLQAGKVTGLSANSDGEIETF